MLSVVQAAVDSLSDGRTSKEKVLIASPGTVGPYDENRQIELPSYTILDIPVTIRIAEQENPSVLPVYAEDAEHIDIPNLNVDGKPRMGMRLQSCSNIHLGDINLFLRGSAIGIRIDSDYAAEGPEQRTKDVQIDSAYIERSGQGLETYGVDRIQVDQVIGNDPSGCVVLFNDTTDATVNSVVGKNPGQPSGYATFRVANSCHDITCGQVVSRGGARGIFGVSECYDITVGEVNIVGSQDNGILIQNCQNFMIDSGIVKNTNGDAVRIDSRDNSDQIPAEGVSITNLRVYDDREKKQQTWGIRETGPRTGNNRITNNDVRDAGTEADIAIFSDTTIVRDNVGGGIAAGATTLTSGTSPAARVEGVSETERSALETRVKPTTTDTNATYAWESYYEWNGIAGVWDLVFEWRTDPDTDIKVDYIVDKSH